MFDVVAGLDNHLDAIRSLLFLGPQAGPQVDQGADGVKPPAALANEKPPVCERDADGPRRTPTRARWRCFGSRLENGDRGPRLIP
jgi:hypothetical protein